MSSIDDTLKQRYRDMIGLGSIYSVSQNTILSGAATVSSNLNISRNTIFNNAITLNSNLNIVGNMISNNLNTNNIYISGNSILNNTIINNSLNVSNNTIITNNLSINSLLYISGNTNIQSTLTLKSNLYVSNNTILNLVSNNSNLYINNYVIANNITFKSNLNISSNSILNNTTIYSNLYISNQTILNNITINSNLYNNNALIDNNLTIQSTLFVSGNTICNNNVLVLGTSNIISNLSVLSNSYLRNTTINGFINCPLNEYDTNTDAAAGGIPYWGLYRTGGIVKIRLDLEAPIVTLNGSSIYNLYINETYTELGASVYDNLGENLTPIISGSVNTNTTGSYILLYSAIDSFNNYSNIPSRTINVYNYPSITNMTFSSNTLTITTNSYFNTKTYLITKSGSTIVSEITFNNSTIDTSGLTLNSTPHYITVFLKRNSVVMWYSVVALTNTKFGPVIHINGNNNLNFKANETLNVFTGITAFNLPDNTSINITSSNVVIKNQLNQTITTPSNGILTIAIGNIFYITYTIIGSNGITTIATRQINIVDGTPPVITLIGTTPSPMYLGATYNEQSVTITDNSGEIISPVISGIVNPNLQGYYNITYSATDSSNNTTTKVRTIIVSDKRPIYRFALLNVSREDTIYRGRFLKFNNLNLISQLRTSINWTFEAWAFHYYTSQNNNSGSLPYYNIGGDTYYPPPSNVVDATYRGQPTNVIFTIMSNNTEIVKLYFIAGDMSTTFGYYIDITWSTGLITYYTSKNQGSYLDTCSFAPNTWNHFAITYDSSTVKLYCNGCLTPYIFNASNYLLGNNTMLNDTLYIGVNTYNTPTDLQLQTLRSKFCGYISQVSCYNYCKYTTHFTPSNDLKPTTNLSNCLFYLDDDYTDLISQNTATIIDNNTMSNTIDKLYRLTMKHPNLILSLPGDILPNNFWCLHDSTKGRPWINMDYIQPVSINQNYSNGLTIGFDIMILYGASWYELAAYNSTWYFDSALLYIGPNPDDISLPHFAFTFNASPNTFNYGNIKYNTYNSGTFQLDYGYGYRLGLGRLYMTLSPNGIFSIYYNSALVKTVNTGVNISSLPSNHGIWLGRYNGINWKGGIFNIKLYDAIVPWNQQN